MFMDCHLRMDWSFGQAKNVLLVTAKTYSKYIQEHDKSNLTIFSDAASCSLVTNSSENAREIRISFR